MINHSWSWSQALLCDRLRPGETPCEILFCDGCKQNQKWSLLSPVYFNHSGCAMKKLVYSIVTVAALAAFGGASAQEVVLVGVSGPLTGPQASEGKDNENGARMAVDELNSAGTTIAGKNATFKLVSPDDQAHPRIGVPVSQKLFDAKVAAVLGPDNS